MEHRLEVGECLRPTSDLLDEFGHQWRRCVGERRPLDDDVVDPRVGRVRGEKRHRAADVEVREDDAQMPLTNESVPVNADRPYIGSRYGTG